MPREPAGVLGSFQRKFSEASWVSLSGRRLGVQDAGRRKGRGVVSWSAAGRLGRGGRGRGMASQVVIPTCRPIP